MKSTIDSKFKNAEYLVIEKGIRGGGAYCDKIGFDSESNARDYYNNQVFHAHGEWYSPTQVKFLKLYEKWGHFFGGKLIVWKPLEKRVNLHFTGSVYS